MNGTLQQAKDLLAAIAPLSTPAVEVVIAPPATLLLLLSQWLRQSEQKNIKFSAQDCHTQACGAFTGDVSAEMLADAGASYVIVGHSERRQQHHEASKMVQEKAVAAKRAGLKPVICVGETLGEREAGKTRDLLTLQIHESIPVGFAAQDFVLAYEPVWAIGTGKVASTKMIAETHEIMISLLPEGAKVLYGGSVGADNAEEIMSLPQVHGVLVGGASLKAESFNTILRAAEKLTKKS